MGLLHIPHLPHLPLVLRQALLGGLALVLSACASYGPGGLAPGASADDAVRQMGQPTARRPLPDGQGTRLEFARGPLGEHTFMVDVDEAGRVTAVQQVLTEANFAKVVPGMTRDALLLLLGRPSEARQNYRGEPIWSYRYESRRCLWFVLTLTREGLVRDAGIMDSPDCSVGGDNFSPP